MRFPAKGKWKWKWFAGVYMEKNEITPEIPVVILCGGEGTRLREETEFKPKPLVEIGGVPILIHIMKIYQAQGFHRFVLCLGYKGDLIKKYFLEHRFMLNDFSMNTNSNEIELHENLHLQDCLVTLADTGRYTLTAGRVKKIQKYVNTEDFMLTYGDGVANIDLQSLWNLHQKKDKMCTITAINPVSKYGLIRIDENQQVLDFLEKPPMKDFVNGGFMVMKRSFFDHLNEDCMFESKVLPRLSASQQVVVYPHSGFWHCLDTYKDYTDLNKIWGQFQPWKVWQE